MKNRSVNILIYKRTDHASEFARRKLIIKHEHLISIISFS